MCIVVFDQLKRLSIPSNVHDCTQPTQSRSFAILITLIPSNVYNYTQQPHIISPSTQMIFNTLKYAQLHLTNSNHHSIASKMHSNLRNTQINTCNLEMYTCNASISKPPCLQAPTDARNVHQCSSNMTHPKDPSKHQKHLRSAP